MEITRTDQALGMPKGMELRNRSGDKIAHKLNSNISDGMELWRITFNEGQPPVETVNILDVEDAWFLI